MFDLSAIEDDDVDTVAGIVVKELGRIAEVGDNVVFAGLSFDVLEIDGARIMKLKIKKLPVEQDQEQTIIE